MNKSNQKISSSSENQASEGNNGTGVLKLGLDVHYRQVTTAMQEEGGRIKAVGKMGHEAFGNWIDKKLAEGWQIYSCYEAGASGYWLHRELERKVRCLNPMDNNVQDHPILLGVPISI
jgi:hypothetical protein